MFAGCAPSVNVTSSTQEAEEQLSEAQDTNTNTTTAAEDTVTAEEKRREELTKIYKEELTDQYQADANGLINFYILAQQRFYAGDYQNALVLINRAAALKENADVLALKGSIYLGLGQNQNFLANWRQALELDPEIPIPPLPYVVQQLQLNGLLDENFQKAF
ncbi:MAG: hypothetical protein JJ971_13090 [Balneolaceae bacterium]|nr:hypothetical protein [Balneolaceae bacterium]MBO6547211.1 hypothetical protein [Balneolaceae bacterium]MBO6647842.1 hypothetical protein [Balneolaceae bacterium]